MGRRMRGVTEKGEEEEQPYSPIWTESGDIPIVFFGVVNHNGKACSISLKDRSPGHAARRHE